MIRPSNTISVRSCPLWPAALRPVAGEIGRVSQRSPPAGRPGGTRSDRRLRSPRARPAAAGAGQPGPGVAEPGGRRWGRRAGARASGECARKTWQASGAPRDRAGTDEAPGRRPRSREPAYFARSGWTTRLAPRTRPRDAARSQTSASCSPARAASAPGWTGRSAWWRRRSAATARPSMSATRSCTTARSSSSSSARARCSSRSWTRCRRTRRSCSPPTACRNPSPPRRSRRNLTYLDATCPLVSKVHREAERHYAGGGPDGGTS